MIKIKFNGSDEFLEAGFTRINDHVIELNGITDAPTTGFTTWRMDGVTQLGDFSDYTTVVKPVVGASVIPPSSITCSLRRENVTSRISSDAFILILIIAYPRFHSQFRSYSVYICTHVICLAPFIWMPKNALLLELTPT